MNKIFNLLTPEIYNGLYAHKSYSQEFEFIDYHLNSLRQPSVRTVRHCVEFGSGTGNLTSLMIENFHSYLAVEPSTSFCTYLHSRFSNYKGVFEILNSNLEESLGELMLRPNQPTLYVANFNVVNYLTQPLFEFILCELSSIASPGSIFVFDSWSLEYVKKMPLVMSSSDVFRIYSENKNNSQSFQGIERSSNSVFDPNLNSLSIDFGFTGIPDTEKPRVNIGEERHTIFPFDLDALRLSFFSSNWEIMGIYPYAAIQAMTWKDYSFCARDLSTCRNWYFVLQIPG